MLLLQGSLTTDLVEHCIPSFFLFCSLTTLLFQIKILEIMRSFAVVNMWIFDFMLSFAFGDLDHQRTCIYWVHS